MNSIESTLRKRGFVFMGRTREGIASGAYRSIPAESQTIVSRRRFIHPRSGMVAIVGSNHVTLVRSGQAGVRAVIPVDEFIQKNEMLDKQRIDLVAPLCDNMPATTGQ